MRRLDNMDLRLLRIFTTLVEAGGFTEAQVELNLSQPTLSTHLSTLEQRLGNRLCDRGRKGFRLTPFGSKAYSAAKQLFADMDNFNSLLGQQSAPRDRLRLGVIDAVATNPSLGLQTSIDRLSRRHPEIFVTLELGAPAELSEWLKEDRIDIAVGPFISKMDRIVYLPIHHELHALYCGKGHPLFGLPGAKVTRKMIDATLFSVRGYRKLDDIYRVGHPRASAQVTRTEAQLMMLLSGQFLGFLPCHVAESWVREGKLWPVKGGSYSFRSQHYVAHGEEKHDDPLVQDMVAFIRRAAIDGEQVQPQFTMG